MNYLPDKLVNLRKHYNYSQNYIAKILDVDVVDYMGYENGRSILNHSQIVKLAKFYHIDYIELFRNDDKVTLYKVDKQDTDKINIEYFIPKNTLLNRIKKFIRNNKLYVGIGIGIVIFAIGLLIFNIVLRKPIKNEIVDINTLSVSNKTVLYLNSNGAAKGSGDNAHSQLSNLPTENVVKVLANDDYSVFLLNDGSLFICGDMDDKQKNDLLKKKDIVDIELGTNHLLLLHNDGSVSCVGSNDNKQCDLDGASGIKRIFAGKNASVAIEEDGNIIYSGDFVGRSSISDLSNIIDIDFDDSSTIYIKEDGSVDYSTNINNKFFIEALKWENIIDVACGKDFFVGLKSDGNVVVASDNPRLKEAEKLSGIISIDAADNYFIAYDGKSIYGFGENRYNQFISSPDDNFKLKAVEDIEIICRKDSISVSFESIDKATGYEIKLNDYSTIYPNNKNISIDASSLTKGEEYSIFIKAIGDDYYEDSDINEFKFEYQYEEENDEPVEEVIKVSADLGQMSKDEFEAYLHSLNISSIESSESDNICPSDKITISDIEGIIAGGSYTKRDIEKLVVKYRYCKIETEETNEEDLES